MDKKYIKTGIVVILTAVFVFFFVRSVNWREVVSRVTGVNVPLFVFAFFLSAFHFLTRGFRWKFLLRNEKKDARYSNMIKGNVVGFTINFVFPGRLGELAKPLYLARKEGMRDGFVIGTVVVERIFDMFTMCLFLGIFLLARPLYASRFALSEESLHSLSVWGLIGVAIATGLLAIILALYFFREKALIVAAFCFRILPRSWRGKALSLVAEFIEGLKFFQSAGGLFIYTLLSFAVWLGIIFFYWIFFLSYGVKVQYFMMVPYIFLTMVGASIPTPGMVGGFDYFSKLGLTTLYGTDPNLAVGMTLVTHAIQVVVTCVLGYVILAREGVSLVELKKMGEIKGK